MIPRIVQFEGARVIGTSLVTSNAAEANPATAKIPAFWARFRNDNVLDTIPGKRPPVAPVGVYTDYESDETGRFRLIAGAIVEKTTQAPDSLSRVELTPGRYLVFSAEGALPGIVIETWQAIWAYFSSGSQPERRAFTTDFEIYPGPTRVDIHVAVQ
jgi:predicted transcriptional regulator YdeE